MRSFFFIEEVQFYEMKKILWSVIQKMFLFKLVLYRNLLTTRLTRQNIQKRCIYFTVRNWKIEKMKKRIFSMLQYCTARMAVCILPERVILIKIIPVSRISLGRQLSNEILEVLLEKIIWRTFIFLLFALNLT